MAMKVALRDYQEEGVSGVRVEFRNGNQPVVYVLPTGGGKTYVFSCIALMAAQNGNPVIIIVHRRELLQQVSDSLRNLGVEHGMISPHYTPDPRKLVQVASVDSLNARIGKKSWRYPPFAMMIGDEGHHFVADNKWGRAYEKLGKPPTLLVTATPVRTDGKGMGEHAGGLCKAMVLGPSVPELIQRGCLIAPTVYTSLEMPDLKGVRKKKDGDYNERQLAERVDKPRITGNAVKQYSEVCPGVPAIVFCVSVEHAKHVVDEFCAAGYRFALLVGEPHMKSGERTRVNNQLRRGDLQGIVTVDLVGEGFDVPDLQCCIMLRSTMSEGLFLQQVGRVMRVSEGKTACWLLDHVGNVGAMQDGEFVRKHGLPDEEREWTLDGRERRPGSGKKEEKPIEMLQCPKCYLVHAPAPKCPKCGHIYKVRERAVEHVDGELVELTAERVAQLKVRRKKEVRNAKTLQELERIAAERGYSPSWARHVFEAKQKKRAQYQRRAGPPAPTREEMLRMTLPELQKVEQEQGWPLGTATEFYHEHHRAQGGF